MNYIPGYVGLKIAPNSPLASCIKIIRKYTKLPIGEIKKKIECNEYLLKVKKIDTIKIKIVRQCYDELLENNIHPELFEIYNTEEISTRQMLSNLIASHTYTETEVLSEIGYELEDLFNSEQ